MTQTTKRALMISAALAAAFWAAPASAADKIVIGFSQASSNSAHRNTMTKRNQDYAAANFADSELVSPMPRENRRSRSPMSKV